MKKLALATAFAAMTLASTAVLANSSVTVGTGITASGPVGGDWISNTSSDTFTIFNPDSLVMVVHVTSLIKDPTSGDDLSNYDITCNPGVTTPVLITAGSSYICRTNTDVAITSDGNATSTAAMGSYQVIFEKAPCSVNCKNMLKK